MSFDSSRKKQTSGAQTGKRPASRAKAQRDLRLTIEEYILDHRSQNHSPKTIEWHTLSLGNFANFLEKKDVTCVEQIERVHILAWLSYLGTEPGAKGKNLLNVRSMGTLARCAPSATGWKCRDMCRSRPRIM